MTTKSPIFSLLEGGDRPYAVADRLPPTMTIPVAGAYFYGLSKNGSYDAAARGEIPYLEVGRLKRVPTALMERIMSEGPALLEALKAGLLSVREAAAGAPAPTRTPARPPARQARSPRLERQTRSSRTAPQAELTEN